MAMATMVEVISCSSSVFLRSRTQVIYTRLCDDVHFRLCIHIHTGTNYVRCGYEDFRLRLNVMGVVAIFWEACYIHPFDDVFLRRAPSRNWVVHSLHIAANCGRCGCGCDQTFLVVYRFGMQFVFFIFGDDVETCPEYEILNPA